VRFRTVGLQTPLLASFGKEKHCIFYLILDIKTLIFRISSPLFLGMLKEIDPTLVSPAAFELIDWPLPTPLRHSKPGAYDNDGSISCHSKKQGVIDFRDRSFQ
jgi:hypothetical protein